MNTRMIEETLVRDHMIHMIAHFNEMRILRAKVNKKNPGRYDPRNLIRLLQAV